MRNPSFASSSEATTAAAVAEVTLDQPHTDAQFAEAVRAHYCDQTPVVLRGAASHMAAIQRWQDLHYLTQRLGDTDFDIEIGGYNRGDGEKVPIPFDQYAQYLELWRQSSEAGEDISDEKLLYLAQNDLPLQLEDDIAVPAVCTNAELGVGKGRLYNRNLWLGPARTFSPLHYDPLDNFLMQIVGRKSVYLLDKRVDTSLLYTGQDHRQQSNTSAVNVERPDYRQHPRFEKAASEMLSTELQPGDTLFIPSRWWHAVRSLDYSISVNAWFR